MEEACPSQSWQVECSSANADTYEHGKEKLADYCYGDLAHHSTMALMCRTSLSVTSLLKSIFHKDPYFDKTGSTINKMCFCIYSTGEIKNNNNIKA